MFNQEEFNEFVLKNKVIGFFNKPVKLKSGRTSNWYVNWRRVTEDVFLLDKLTDYVIEFAKWHGLKPDCFYGVPEGATKIGILAQYKWARRSLDYGPGSHVLAMGRGKPKDHGAPKDKHFIGQPRGETIILEDTATTGGSLLKTINTLSGIGIHILAAFSLTDRMELSDDGRSVKEAVEAKGVPYYSLSNALQLLPEAIKKTKPGERIVKAIEEELALENTETES